MVEMDTSSHRDGISSGEVVAFVSELAVAVLIVALPMTVFAGSKSQSAESDIFVSALVLYAKLTANSPEAKEHGSYPQRKSYDIHGGWRRTKLM